MGKDKFIEPLQRAGLGDYVEAILRYAKPCIRLHAQPADNLNTLSLGASRIGGLPDLPPGAAWLTRNGRYCEFIAQLDLAEASKYDETGLLPNKGALLFFFDGRDYEDTEYQPYQKGSETIIYYTGALASLERATAYPSSLENWQPYRACSIDFEADWMLPNWPAAASFALEQEVLHATGFEQYGEETPLVKAYRQLTDELEPEQDRDKHHLFGYPEPVIQDDPLYQVADAWDGQKMGDPLVADWVQFLQISSDDGPGMLWGDTSSLYYLIRKHDLIARTFENAVCIEQNC